MNLEEIFGPFASKHCAVHAGLNWGLSLKRHLGNRLMKAERLNQLKESNERCQISHTTQSFVVSSPSTLCIVFMANV